MSGNPYANCVLPSGKQMQDANVPEQVQAEVRQLALSVLQKLLAPLIFTKKGIRAREEVSHKFLEYLSEEDLRSATEKAFLFTSYLSHHAPGLAPAVTRHVSDGGVPLSATTTLPTKAEPAVEDRYASSAPRSGNDTATPASLSSKTASSSAYGSSPSSSMREHEQQKQQEEVEEKEQNRSASFPSSVKHQEEEEAEAEAEATNNKENKTPPAAEEPLLPSGAILSPNRTSPNKRRSFLEGSNPLFNSTPAGEELDSTNTNRIREAIRDAISFAEVRVCLHGECIQWLHEPAHEVLVLLAGAVQRTYPNFDPSTSHALKLSSKPPNRHGSNDRTNSSSLETSRKGSSALNAQLFGADTAAVRTSSGGYRRLSVALDGLLTRPPGSGTLNSTGSGAQGGRLSLSRSGAGNSRMSLGANSNNNNKYILSEEEIHAPFVFGEIPCIGGFPYCQQLRVTSDTALVLKLGLTHYMQLLGSCPKEVQQSCMRDAILWRQHYLPFYAPLTLSRLRLCPLLTGLKRDRLEQLRQCVVPRAIPAGMQTNGPQNSAATAGDPRRPSNFAFPSSNNVSTSGLFNNNNNNNNNTNEVFVPHRIDPQSIYFIRRGVVYLQREGFSQGEDGSPFCAKNRKLLVEGHTFGEINSIFGENTGDCYYAVSPVDLYVLPFQAVIDVMKSGAEVQQSVYQAARYLSNLYEKEQSGIRFNSADMKSLLLNGINGVMSRKSLIALHAATYLGSSYNTSNHPQGNNNMNLNVAALAGNFASASRRSISPQGESTPLVRRVTIYEGENSTNRNNNNNNNLQNGSLARGQSVTFMEAAGGGMNEKVFSYLLQMPLLSLLSGGGNTSNTNNNTTSSTPNNNHNNNLNESFSSFLQESMNYWRCYRLDRGEVIVRRGEECNRVLLFTEGKVAVIEDEVEFNRYKKEVRRQLGSITPNMNNNEAAMNRMGNSAFAIPAYAPDAPGLVPMPLGKCIGFTCVRRHRWTRSVLALDDGVEVWELKRSHYVHLLEKYRLERAMQVSVLQLLQPLCSGSKERVMALDFQPLLRPLPNSLWSEEKVPLLYPVSLAESGPTNATSSSSSSSSANSLFPVWKEGDFPLD